MRYYGSPNSDGYQSLGAKLADLSGSGPHTFGPGTFGYDLQGSIGLDLRLRCQCSQCVLQGVAIVSGCATLRLCGSFMPLT